MRACEAVLALEPRPPISLETPALHPAAPALSVIITNYNYARFLPVAIDSVLSQDGDLELIVVDDCSTDNSRDVISGYGERLKPIFLEVNGGQGAGFNAGFAAARGDLVMFLDADDYLLPGAARQIIANRKPGVSLYLYPMRYSDEQGVLGGIYPGHSFPDGDLSEMLRLRGRYNGTITSGMVMDRERMKSFMPMDSEAFRYGGDGHVAMAAPLYGKVSGETDIISAYRLHDAQHTRSSEGALAKRARWRIEHDHARYAVLRDHAARLALPVSDRLGTDDAAHVKERLISLMYEPASHPVAGDNVKDLLARLRTLTLAQVPGPYGYLRAGWWTFLSVLPDGLRRRVFFLEIVPASRPAWLKSVARLLRRKA